MASRKYVNESDEPASLLRDLCVEMINKEGRGDLREIYKLATVTLHGNVPRSPKCFMNEFILEKNLEKFVYSTYDDKSIVRRMNEAIYRLRNTKSGEFSGTTSDCLTLMLSLVKNNFGDSSDDSSLSIGNNLSISRSSKEGRLDESPLAFTSSQTVPMNQYHSSPSESSAINTHRGSSDALRGKINKTPSNGYNEIHIGAGDSSLSKKYNNRTGSGDSLSKIYSHTGSGDSFSKIHNHTGPGDSLPKIYNHTGSGDSLSKIHIIQKKILHNSQQSNESKDASRRPDTLNVSTTKNARRDDAVECITELLVELTFCFVGIPGEIIENDGGDEFTLNPKFKVKDAQVVLHLIKIGTVYKQVTRYSENIKKRGAIGQAVSDAVLVIIQKFQSKVADLRERIEIVANYTEDTLSEQLVYKFPTLKQIMVVFKSDLSLLQYLCDVLSSLQDKHGGQIVTCLAFYLSNVPLIRSDYLQSITMLFAYAARPYYMMIADWITKGTLKDQNKEIFVESMSDVDGNSTWEKEYKIRKEMLPEFITERDAELIIEVGKWTNFLHVCKELPQLTKTQLSLQKYVLKTKDEEFSSSLLARPNKVMRIIKTIHAESSHSVLKALNVKFQLKMHLNALRQYMLLGQGDFFNNLIILSSDELDKPARSLHLPKLNGVIETAIRTSGAQYDDEQVICRVQAKMFPITDSDIGWDCFSLTYEIPHPIVTVLKLESSVYGRVFTLIWKIKRARHYLRNEWAICSLMRRNYSSYIPNAVSAFIELDALIMEITHCVKCLEYYFQRDVVEQCWIAFKEEFVKMQSLEKVYKAHKVFMKAIQDGCFMVFLSELMLHLRTILDSVTDLWHVVGSFENECDTQVKRVKENLNSENENENFLLVLKECKIKFRVFLYNHQECLSKLLVKLWNSKEYSLQLLGQQMDFNGKYKKADVNLSESLKFAKQPGYKQFSQSISRLSISSTH